MNIFVTSECPWTAAEYLDPVRRNKMITETQQMFAAILHGLNAPKIPLKKDGNRYGISHPNHPCTKWARRTRGNYLWLLEHLEALYLEYVTNDAKDREPAHKHVPANIELIREMAYLVPEGDRTPFQNSAANREKGLDFTHLPVPESYINFLEAQK